MKVLLIKPHVPRIAKGEAPPLGLGYIASSLLQDGHEVKIKDLTLYKSSEIEQSLKKKVERFSPDIVGITCNSNERFYAFDIATWVKAVNEEIRVVMGGSHVTILAEETLRNTSCCDIIVHGEGELTMKELCNRIENGESIRNIKGISYRNKNGHVHTTPARPFNTDLDALPLPARHLMEVDKYNFSLLLPGHSQKVTTMISSRGCPFGCNFCSATILAGNRIRFRSPEKCVDEVEEIFSDHPFLDGIAFMDDHFLTNKKRATNICEEIKKRNLDFDWYCWGRVDSISRELVQVLKSAGCKVISMGVESGSPKVLKAMNKRANPKQAIDAIKTIKREGLTARGSFIYNYPGEGLIDIFKTYLLLMKSGLTPHEITVATYPIAYPATNLFEKLKKQKYIPENFDWENRFNIPNYKDVPIYKPPNDSLRQKIISFLLKVNKIAYCTKNPFYIGDKLKQQIKKF